ncbi:hypothetical protein EHS25_007776 [Saitozyma podzolica]|uniref:Aquaporin n=1 Tax=Saitozyma podzolica TaxID=1890683 RepID=A0A427YQS9_9TREE|nr:hypothetical protein EHS25_007776 [Saitozyma podzolica]
MSSKNPFFPSDLDVESQSPPTTLTESPQPEISRHDYASPSPTPTVHSGGNGTSGDTGGGRGDSVPDGTQQSKLERPGQPRGRAREGRRACCVMAHRRSELFLDVKNDSIAMAGEFIGTVLFLVLALGAVQATKTNLAIGNDSSNPQGSTAERVIANYYQSAAFGLSLYATSSIFYRFTGSIFNPSVSLALTICGVVRPVRFFLVSAAQMVGGITACWILSALLPGSANINLSLGANTNVAQGLFIEMFATITLVLNVLMLGAEKHMVTPHAPLGFGLTLFVITLFSIEYTGTGINVARAFGAATVNGFQTYHWIYWLGPTLGALLATGFYIFLRKVEYWRINPGQDATSMEPHPSAAALDPTASSVSDRR